MARKDLEDILAGLAADRDEFDADGFRNAVLAAYDSDISVRDTAVQDRESRLAKAAEDLNAQKLKNYELLMSVPADPSKVQTPGQANQPSSDPDESATADDLFGE